MILKLSMLARADYLKIFMQDCIEKPKILYNFHIEKYQ